MMLKEFSVDFDILRLVRDELIQIQIIQGLVGTGENKTAFVYSSSHSRAYAGARL
jgi:hypothetical protein